MGIEWKIEFTPLARRHLDELEDRVRIEAIQAIVDFREDPFPLGHLELRGHRGVYRIHFYRDQYRIIYRVSEKRGTVLIWRVRPRGSAYAGL
jgi:mRNA-degrading endonuclease RelE of RelBE toxin-antitoxin system